MAAAERSDEAATAAGDPRRVRNTCILAHVDHGKTTLADHLVASCGDGLLHPKLAGRLRFMDYLDEEQRRAITMKSAAVALRSRDGHRVSLIDSPGHIDFCSEVSSAARLSDSALILVDAVEGVHIQTHAALRQAFVERLRPCLVLNKIDRLITELCLTPAEAYTRLHRIVSDVNSIYSALRSHSYFSLLSTLEDNPSSSSSSSPEDLPEDFEDDDDNEDAFQPLKGNVVFACALDGWGFRPQQFADLYARKVGVNPSAFLRGLWGPRYLDKKTRKVVGKKAMTGADPQPMFAEFVLSALWKMYELVLTDGGESKRVKKLVENFQLKIPERELKNKDQKLVLQSVMSRWLPLADAVMDMVVECTPDPVAAQGVRVARLMPKREVTPEDAADCPEIVSEAERVRRCVEACDVSVDAPVVVYVSKMFAVPYKMLPLKGVNGELLNHHGAIESEECFMAFARVFSGVLRAGQKVFVLSSLYDPLKGDAVQKHVQEVELQYLYEMLGQGLKPVASVGAGNVVAIQGLGQQILKSATLSSTKSCWPFSSMMFQASPMLKVAIEPSNPADLGGLVKGLKLLNRADPFVEYTVTQRGEHVLAAAGEIHLERCIKDLEERFAKVKLLVSEPLVSFKETIEGEGVAVERLKAPQEFAERTTPNGRCTVRVQVLRLPDGLTKVLEESEQLIGQIIEGKIAKRDGVLDPRLSQDDGDSAGMLRQRMIDAIDSDLEAISKQVDKEKLDRCRKTWLGYLERIWSLGPWQVGPNLLLSPDKSSDGAITIQDGRQGILVSGRSDISERLGFLKESDAKENSNLDNGESAANASESLHLESMALRNNIVSGFQIAANAGPLCDEPMWGLAFIVEPYLFADGSYASNLSDQYNIFSGQVITAVKEACRAAVLQNKPRLVEAMYFCELTVPSEQVGTTYVVLRKRRARILKEEIQEGTSLFIIQAYLPVAESVGFSNELRSLTAGAASALLVLSHWEAIGEDPFFIPKTQDELEEFGDGSSIGPNLAKRLMNSVRRRKGLHVEEKVVEHGSKQRTLAKKV
ncbi:unnamed protein product [Urochloa humidicola]